jgi:hypothetical protein
LFWHSGNSSIATILYAIAEGGTISGSFSYVSKSLVLTGDVTDRLAEEVVKTHGSTRAGFIED